MPVAARGPRATERGERTLGTTLVSLRKKQDEPAAEEPAVAEVEAPPETQAAEPAAEDSPTGPKKRRRRGSRGGRGKKKPRRLPRTRTATPGGSGRGSARDPCSGTGEAAEQGRRRKAAERRQQRGGGRRRTPTKRAPLPAAKRELMISVDVGEQRVAILEDDRVAEVYLERPERRSIAGNIYLGVVDNVLPGMEAAFVEIGLEKNGFLYVDEIVGPELEGRKGARKIQDLIKRGQTLMVQAVKDPMKSKGARLTTEISLPGRFLVYVPNGEGSGVSRRLEDAERTRLKEIVRKLDPKGGGIIVRTAAEGRLGRGHRARPRVPAAPVEDDPGEGQDRDGSDARLRGGRASAAHRARPLRRGLHRRADRRRPNAPAHRQLPQEDLAAHGRARAPLPREGAALRSIRRRRRDPLDARSPCRPAVRRLPRLRLRGGLHRHRREHRPVRRLAGQERPGTARGHDRQEQPRGRERGRSPASAPRHRRDHRHRLHRHGESQEPGDGRGGAPLRARARPHEDVRRRDLAARAGRDDTPERHRRPA